MLSVYAVPAFTDNYIWLIEHTTSKQTIIVDPGDARPVIEVLEQKVLRPVAILITHQHYDHINGVKDLVRQFNLPVFGLKTSVDDVITHDLCDLAEVAIDSEFPEIQVLSTPGHTAAHLSYLIEDKLFCGDTLFAAGCGRLLDPIGKPLADSLKPSAAKQLLKSLSKLAALPATTLVYCTHEYTLANLRFAQQVEPNNTIIKQRLKQVEMLRQNQQASLPSTIKLEHETNPFLHCDQDAVMAAVSAYKGYELASKDDVFFALRQWKDNF